MTNQRILNLTAFVLVSLLQQACSSFSPPREVDAAFLKRVETQQSGSVRVSAVVLSDKEGNETFAAPMARKDIQPVWLEIENMGDVELRLMLLGIDHDYFSPSEAAWRSRRLF